jgi:hypothetical protein
VSEARGVTRDLVTDEELDRLLGAVRVELEHQDTDHPLFHGSWDWHSSVHGHWTALTFGALRGRHAQLGWVTDRLRSDAFVAEVDHLLAHPEFELPYGRAWLLALMNTYERLTGDTSLRSAMEPVARSVHDWCTGSAPGPEAQEYQNPCWPLLHLWRWSGDERGELTAVIRDRFLGHEVSLSDDEERPGGFFSRWALQAHLIGGTLGADALSAWLQGQADEPDDTEALHVLHSAHHLGTNATRAWGFWSAYWATGEARWRAAYERHLRASLDLHETWAEDRRAYGHWVPQFTLYAAHLATEDSPRTSGGAPR